MPPSPRAKSAWKFTPPGSPDPCIYGVRGVNSRHPKQQIFVVWRPVRPPRARGFWLFLSPIASLHEANLVVTAATHLEPVFEPVIEQAGFKLVRLRMMGGASRTLQVMAERADGSMDVEGCSALSHALLDFIEAEDPIE